MKKVIAFLTSLVISFVVLSQTPGVRWQRTLSSNEDDYFITVKTSDNGLISIGNRQGGISGWYAEKFNSDGVRQWQMLYPFINGLVERAVSYYYNTDGSLVILFSSTTIFGQYDFHVVKMDQNGILLWENYFGGSEQDVPSCITKSASGGYILVGNTNSHDGNVPGIHGSVDSWLIRINEDGLQMWQKPLGGNSVEGTSRYDSKGKVVEAADGSIYVVTETASNDGDATGNHGAQDILLIKLNNAGVIQWSKCLGGSGDDISTDLKLSPAGDLCVLGSSSSPELTINGAQQVDFYFASVSPAGNVLFQKCYGSTSGGDAPIQIASVDNSGYVLAGHVNKADGDVQTIHGTNTNDIWIFKINPAGNILWQKSIGGSAAETIFFIDIPPAAVISGGVLQTSDGGYLISSQTQSNDGDVTGGLHGAQDILVAKLSGSGNLDWTRSIGGSSRELPKGLPVELGPNEYVIGGLTYSSDGDIQRYYGNGDPWLVKLGPVNTIKGSLFLDQNSNGIKDAAEPLFSDANITISKGPSDWNVVPYNENFI